MFGRSPQDEVDLAHLTERVARLEATVAQLQAQLQAQLLAPPTAAAPGAPAGAPASAPVEPPFMAEVRELKARGKLIHAIKVYRVHTGVGLKEAKDFVEALR